jgi:His-Xaa-Ser system radical SAM maturase HxsB
MAESLFLNSENVRMPYTVNKYWNRKLDDKHILVTTEHGAWVVLSKKEFNLLKDEKILEDLNLFGILEDKGVIITGNNVEKLTQMYRERFHHLFSGINLHIITTTLRCNQKCIYCHANSKPVNAKEFDMNDKTAKSVVDFIFQTPSPFISIEFQGGEPLLNFPVVKFIIEYAKQKNRSYVANENGKYVGKKILSFQMVSNFTVMNDEMLDYMMDNSVGLCTSLDGPKNLHDKNRPWGGGGGYKKVVYWIKKAKVTGYKFFSSAMPTITKYSLPYWKEIVDEYLKYGFTQMRMRPLNIAGIAAGSWEKIGYSPEEFFEFWKKYIDYLIKINKKVVLRDDDTVYMLRRIVTLKPPFNACLGAPCGGCTIQSAYNFNGDVYTCDEAKSFDLFKLGNVEGSSYKKIFTSPEAQNFIGLSSMTSSLCDTCALHPYCSPCLVSSYGAHGNLIPKLPVDFLCKVRSKQVEYIFKKLLFSEDDRKMFLNWVAKSGV